MKAHFGTLLIVDVQKAFPVPPAFLNRLRAYAARFRRRIFTRFVNPPNSPFRRHLAQHSCAPGSEDTELLIPPGPREWVINKASYGLSPAVIRRMRRLKIRDLTVCGIDTDACVLGVMFSLFDAGIRCRVNPRYCHSTSGLQRAALQIIESQFELLR